MGRTGVILLIVGLAVGLFLGFNPSTHRAIVRWWDRETRIQGRAEPHTAFSLRQLDKSVARLFRTAPRPETPPKSENPRLVTWDQIVAAFQAFWHALEQIWLSFIAKLKT